MRYFISLILLCLCIGCSNNNGIIVQADLKSIDNDSFDIGISIEEPPEVTYIIGISALDRDMLIDCIKEQIKCYGGDTEVHVLNITLQNRARGLEGNYKVRTFEEIPFSSVHFRDNMWFIRYENNKGYMPITRGVKKPVVRFR